MRTYTTTRDPWQEISQNFDRCRTIVRGSSAIYETPEYRIRYYPGQRTAEIRDWELGGFSQIQKYAAQWLEAHDAPATPAPIIGINTDLFCAFNNVYRGGYYIDVSAAHWQTAYFLGIIPERFYRKFLKKKYVRNAMIGSLAATTYVYEWEKGQGKRLIEVQKNPNAGAYWAISSFVAERMGLSQQEAFFYWVDCLYTPFADAIDFLKNSFPPGYSFHEKRFMKVSFDPAKAAAYAVLNRGEPPRPYYFSRNFAFFDTEATETTLQKTRKP